MKCLPLLVASVLFVAPPLLAEDAPVVPVVPAVPGAPAPPAPPERQVDMVNALHHLKDAKADLETSSDPLDGHRAAALKSTDEAILEVEAGIGPVPPVKVAAPAVREEKATHAEVRKALMHLRAAKGDLEKCDQDFQGHRAAAIRKTDESIKEIEAGLKIDVK